MDYISLCISQAITCDDITLCHYKGWSTVHVEKLLHCLQQMSCAHAVVADLSPTHYFIPYYPTMCMFPQLLTVKHLSQLSSCHNTLTVKEKHWPRHLTDRPLFILNFTRDKKWLFPTWAFKAALMVQQAVSEPFHPCNYRQRLYITAREKRLSTKTTIHVHCGIICCVLDGPGLHKM